MTLVATPHSSDAIDREIEACEGIHHYQDEYWQGVVDALMWVRGKTPPPSNDLPR